jgi:hypothetical protein
MLKHLIIQMFVVLQAPMHACALHYDTIECPASCWQPVAGSMSTLMLKHLIIQMFVVLQAPMHAAQCIMTLSSV